MQINQEALDKAFDALKTYDWGNDREVLNGIDNAIVATQGDAAARKEIEVRLIAVLGGDVKRAAKDYVCRKLKTMGTAGSVPALAALLADKDLSHMARYALERIPAPEAAAAMRDALPKLGGALKVGAIGSLGVRRDAGSVGALAGLLSDGDTAIVAAAANSLGVIGTPEAGKALGDAAKKDAKASITDGCLACAERLLADGKKAEALAIYRSLNGEDQSPQVRRAASRGILTAAGAK